MTHVVRTVDCVQLGTFDERICVIKLAFIAKNLRQGIKSPKQLAVPVERRRDSEDYLEMVNSLLYFALGPIYLTESTMRFAEPELIIFP